eukprot:12748083-Ditylum_brightwellii.AAC.1
MVGGRELKPDVINEKDEGIQNSSNCPGLGTKVDKTHAISSGIIHVPYLIISNAPKFAYLSMEDIKVLKRVNNDNSIEKYDTFLDDHAVIVEKLIVIEESGFQYHLLICLIPNNAEKA